MIEQIKHVVEEQKRVKELEKTVLGDGILSVKLNEVHVRKDRLIEFNGGTEGLEIEDRGCNDYPYEVFAYVDGIKFFHLATDEDLNETYEGVFNHRLIQELEEKLASLKGVKEEVGTSEPVGDTMAWKNWRV
jgi:hypothetical protein